MFLQMLKRQQNCEIVKWECLITKRTIDTVESDGQVICAVSTVLIKNVCTRRYFTQSTWIWFCTNTACEIWPDVNFSNYTKVHQAGEVGSGVVDRPTQLIHIGISICRVCQHTSTKDKAGQSARSGHGWCPNSFHYFTKNVFTRRNFTQSRWFYTN